MFYCAEEAMTWVCVRLMKSTSSRGNKKKEKEKNGRQKKGTKGRKRLEKKGQSPAVEEFVNKDYICKSVSSTCDL